MRQLIAVAVTFVVVGGCSWIYNPDGLGKKPDAPKGFEDAPPPDTEIIYPPNPADLALSSIYPTSIDEGRGSNGGRPALLVLRGSNFDGSDGLVVTVSADDGGEALTFDTTVAGDHNFIALSVVAPVDSSCGEGSGHKYSVSVDETGATQQTIIGALELACHDELPASGSGSASVALDSDTLPPMYSQIKITGTLTITGTANAIIKSASTIEINGLISADASKQTPGPGGKEGGGIAQPGIGAGGGGTALLSGGGAGFATAGTAGSAGGAGGVVVGEASITSYASNYASGGGGDGTLNAVGTVGGGGGGTVELTATGDITIGSVSAQGGGVNASTGAGAGGVIVVRPIGGTTHGAVTLDVNGGTPGATGSVGRTRVDGQTDMPITAGYHGPGFGTVPLISDGVQVPTISTFAQQNEMVNGSVISEQGFITAFSFTGGQNMTTYGYGPANAMIPLTAGYNQVCVVVKGGDPNNDTAKDCIEMAYLP